MIRTASQQNRKSLVWLLSLVFVRFLSLCFFIFQNLPALFLDFSSIYCLSIEGLSQRFMGSFLAYSQLLEILVICFSSALGWAKLMTGVSIGFFRLMTDLMTSL